MSGQAERNNKSSIIYSYFIPGITGRARCLETTSTYGKPNLLQAFEDDDYSKFFRGKASRLNHHGKSATPSSYRFEFSEKTINVKRFLCDLSQDDSSDANPTLDSSGDNTNSIGTDSIPSFLKHQATRNGGPNINRETTLQRRQSHQSLSDSNNFFAEGKIRKSFLKSKSLTKVIGELSASKTTHAAALREQDIRPEKDICPSLCYTSFLKESLAKAGHHEEKQKMMNGKSIFRYELRNRKGSYTSVHTKLNFDEIRIDKSLESYLAKMRQNRDSARTQENALKKIWNYSMICDAKKSEIIEKGVMDDILVCMESHRQSKAIQRIASRCLWSLSQSGLILPELLCAIELLFQSLIDFNQDIKTIKLIFQALRYITLRDQFREQALNRDKVHCILKVMDKHSESRSIQRNGCAILSNLSNHERNTASSQLEDHIIVLLRVLRDNIGCQDIVKRVCLILKRYCKNELDLKELARRQSDVEKLLHQVSLRALTPDIRHDAKEILFHIYFFRLYTALSPPISIL
jgi:hypothetical protein